MCLAVYLASSQPLATSEWNEKAPAFYLKAADGDSVRGKFSLPHVYYAGSHEGCGCGFFKEWKPDEELSRGQENYIALARTLREALARGARMELFSCWEGDQDKKPESVGSVTPDELEEPPFELKELQLLRVVSERDQPAGKAQ